MKRGGSRPRKAGIRQEREFADRFPEFHRVVGSGAFGGLDPLLKGDLKGTLGRMRFLLEMKAWAKVDARGEKQISLGIGILDKIRQEALTEDRYAGVIYHPKGTNRYLAIFDWEDFYKIFKEQEEYIERLEAEVDARGFDAR